MDKLKAFASFVSVATKGSLTAAAKAEGVAPANPGRWVIASDTTVAVDHHVLGKPEDAEDAVRIAGQARRRIKENFAISLLYNVVAVPIALIGLATPLAAAIAMSSSSITVSLNSLRLK